HKKTSPTDQYIFQRRVSKPTSSSFHDESPYEVLGQSDSEEESEKIVLGVEKDPGNAEARVQSTSSPVVHAGSDRFTATVYPNVQENLKLAVEEPVLLEEPASSSGTLSSLQHLSRDFSFGDQFFSDKPSDADKSAKTEVESMSHEDHMQLFEALEKSINCDHSEELAHDLAEVRKKRKKGCESPKTPLGSPSHQPPPPAPPAGQSGTSGAPRASGSQMTPPPPPPTSTNQDSPSKGSAAPSLTKTAATTEHQAWSTLDVTLKPLVSLTPEDLDMDEAMGPDEQAQLSDKEDIGSDHIPTVNLRQGWWKPFEEKRPITPEPAWSIRSSDTGDITTFMDWFCKRRGITERKPQDLEGPAYEIVKAQHQQTTTTGGPPGQVTIQSDFFFNKDLEYLRYGSKGRRLALSISKMKAAYYPDAGLEQMVPDQFWIEKECKYDIAAIIVRTHMRILSVVRIEVFSIYGYDYMKKIVLRRTYLNEHVIAERDFKYLYPSDFEDLNLLNIQEDFQLGIESYQTQVNLTKPQWTAMGFEYKHDYTVIESPRVVIFRDKYGVQMMMRFNEIHKFGDGTLHQIVEALDYRVKEFRMNPGIPTVAAAGQKDVNSQLHAHSSNSSSMTAKRP
nr:hypothetical protein [Tanacetum cinerariifolium]